MTEVEVPYIGGPYDGNVEYFDDDEDLIAEFLAKGYYGQIEEDYDPRRPGTNPVHRYDFTRTAGELRLVYAGIMPSGTYTPGRVDDFARPDAAVDEPECE
ncbi:hypothetical protein [Saccharopolyspora pogona]|uniref:hypothetical protein n=1 Tax=Saccharopolyspora pogona TaxID=333966 RepID=UPI001687E0CD|nr:hypothetical protein [Saccharopolyspora pogona]